MEGWLQAAIDYIPRWIAYQMRAFERPGCVIAVGHRDQIVLERAFGFADLGTGEPLTPRHRFRAASHSKSFTAAGVMKLREQGRLGLDDAVGEYVEGLHRRVARATIGELLSHSAGITRDGPDAGQFIDRRPYRSMEELLADLRQPPILDAGVRFKYSNHGYGLLGLVITAVTSEPFASWIKREVVDAVGLKETVTDAPLPRDCSFARGHSGKMLLGRRVVIPSDNPTNAIAPAGGFVSTARDLVRYYAQLSPKAKNSVISAASRRAMGRRLWRDPVSSLESYYGYGLMSGSLAGWDWLGHGGGFQGHITRTSVLPGPELTVSVLTNSSDGLAPVWLNGIVEILRAYADGGAPSRTTRGWTGRWWGHGGAVDLLPMRKKVMVATSVLLNPLLDASELKVSRGDRAQIVRAGGYASYGEPARLVRRRGKAVEFWLAGSKLLSEREVAKEVTKRYEGRRRKRKMHGKGKS